MLGIFKISGLIDSGADIFRAAVFRKIFPKEQEYAGENTEPGKPVVTSSSSTWLLSWRMAGPPPYHGGVGTTQKLLGRDGDTRAISVPHRGSSGDRFLHCLPAIIRGGTRSRETAVGGAAGESIAAAAPAQPQQHIERAYKVG